MKTGFYVAVAAMAAVVVASNILVQFLFGDWLTWGAFTYPFAFLVNEIANRLYGPRVARKVVYVGFVVGLICSAVGTQIEGAFGPLVSARVAVASGVAFLCAQLLDVVIFDRLRRQAWWRPPLVSGLVSSSLDTAVFFSIAFSAALVPLAPGVDVAWANEPVPLLGAGPTAPLWVSLAVADWCVKLAVGVVALAPFRLAVVRYADRP